MTYGLGGYVRIVGAGLYDSPPLTGQVGQIVEHYTAEVWVVETRPGAYTGNRSGTYDSDRWDDFPESNLVHATEDEIADYLIRTLSD